MEHRNTQFNGHMIDMEVDQQGQIHLYEPSIFYGNIPNFPQPSFPYHIPEHHATTFFYGIPQYNGVQPQPQHPAANLDLAITAPSGHYYPYLAPPSGIRDFPVQVNHGPHDQLSLSTYGRDMPYMDDDIRGPFKRKNASAGSSSSVAPMTPGPAESDLNSMDGGTDPTSMIISGSHRRNRPGPGMIAPESVLSHYANPFFQGNFVAPPVPLPGNHPWLDTFAWSNLSFVHAGVHGGPHNQAPPMQGLREYNGNNLPSQVATSSRRISAVGSSNAGINHVQDVVEAGPTFLAPVAPMGFRWYRPRHREIILDSGARHRNALPHLRVLPEDEFAILEIPGYHEAGHSIDQHRDMRLDVDDMSYEELLELGEQIGTVGSGLSEEFVCNNLKRRTFISAAAHFNLEEATCKNQQANFCVICQNDYEDKENIGTVDCGHEYHTECIKKWLFMKNTCPVCKSTALSSSSNDS